MASFSKYQIFVQELGRKSHNLHTDQLAIALSNTAPDTADALLADASEISNGNGYTSSAGTLLLTGISYAHTAGVGKLVATDCVITASGGTIGPFRYVILYNATATGDMLIGYWDRGASLTLQDGESFTTDFDASNGILTIT